MKDRYKKEEGSKSKSGKTVLRISKTGTQYYYNIDKYNESRERLRLKKEQSGGKTYQKQRLSPLCADKKSDSYMRYYEQKCDIRNEYPKWLYMSREQHREYINRIWKLMEGVDYQQWFKIDNKTQAEQMEDEWWKEKNEKSKNYDGRGEEYR